MPTQFEFVYANQHCREGIYALNFRVLPGTASKGRREYDVVENNKSINDSIARNLCLPKNILSSYGKVHVLRPW
jgi:hypothetical protein